MKGPSKSSTSQPISLGNLELLDRVQRCLTGKSEFESESDYLDALEKIGLTLNIVVNHAVSGHKLSGCFLAVLMIYLRDHKARLEQANRGFATLYAKLESARRTTKRSRGLRERIEGIMFTAQLWRGIGRISKQLSADDIDCWSNDAVMKLPSPDSRSASAIMEWSDYVYSEFRKIRSELAEQPGIGNRKRYQVEILRITFALRYP